MILTKKATSIVEAIVVLFIVVSGVVGMFKVYDSSQKLSNSTSNKIQAIQMAREAIEGIKNIRDTNWILFASDTTNCWNVLNYNNSCVGNNSTTNDIQPGTYKIFKNSENKWILSEKSTSETEFKKSAYRNEMKVGLDSNGFFTQSGVVTQIKPLFTREIKISYLKADNSSGNSNDPKVQVISKVQWVDNSSTKSHKVEFKSILTNWKK